MLTTERPVRGCAMNNSDKSGVLILLVVLVFVGFFSDGILIRMISCLFVVECFLVSNDELYDVFNNLVNTYFAYTRSVN